MLLLLYSIGCWAILRKLLGLGPLSPGAATPTILTQACPNPNGQNNNVTVSVGIAGRYQLLIRRDEMVIVGPNAWYPIQTSHYSINDSGCMAMTAISGNLEK